MPEGTRTRRMAVAGARVTAALLLALALGAGVSPATSFECPRWRAAFAAMPTRTITIESEGRPLGVTVKIARTGEELAAGFQCATPAEIDRHLILFDFGREILTQFHMSNVPAPLDIAFIKGDGRIFSILQMAPSPTRLYGPMGAFRFALEAREGFYASRGIQPGAARLVFPAPR